MMFLRELRSPDSPTSPQLVWKKILREHPQLVGLFQPGNEARLQQARERLPRLESAVSHFGFPPVALLEEMARDTGDVGSPQGYKFTAANMPFVAGHKLTDDQLKSFFSDGYILCKNVVSSELICAAKRFINACLGAKKGDIKTNMMVLPYELSSHQCIMDLFYGAGSKLPTIAQSLLGFGNCNPPLGSQVALRFPSSFNNIEDDSMRYKVMLSLTLSIPFPIYQNFLSYPSTFRCAVGGRRWHIDGFNENKHSPFTLLVGVCLSNCEDPGSGNFAVHPGAHWTLQEAVREQVMRGGGAFSSEEFNMQKPDLGQPVQLMMQAGDCVVAHQKLPHLGMPNCSSDIRYQVYFRLRHREHDNMIDAWLDDILLPFEPVRAAASK